MLIINLIPGIFLVIIGILINTCPNHIASHNSLTKDQKASVDIYSLSTFLRNALFILGLVIIFRA